MKIKVFYKSQVEVANVLSEVIYAYLENKNEENFMINSINTTIRRGL